MLNKKFITVSLVVLFILLVALFIYRQPIREQIIASRDRTETVNTIENFYKEHLRAINTNENWVDLAEEYASGRAKELLTARAGSFLAEASQGKQRLAEIVSPIIIRFYDINSSQIKALVDFELEERIVGAAPKVYAIEKLLVLEKVGNKWVIVEDIDRSDRFNEWAGQQSFPTVRVAY